MSESVDNEINDLIYFTTRVPDTSDTSATRATGIRHECNTSDTSAARVRRECYTNDASATRVKNFDFDNDTSENMFSNPYIFYMASERLQGAEKFHFKNYLFEMHCFHAKMRLKSAQQKAISKLYTLDCSCKYPYTFPYSYA